VDKTTTLNDAQNEKSNSSANEAQKTRPFSFLGLLLSTPVWLHVGHLFDMLITFQINREASLGLAHQIDTDNQRVMNFFSLTF
jgi:hypothetical protein